MKRSHIPPSLQRELFLLNEAACCICQKPNVQIHHIDGNNRNNKLSNLALLCIEHHALASTKSSMTKSLSPEVVKKFKNNWELHVTKKRGLYTTKKISRSNYLESKSTKFELKKLIIYLPTQKNRQSIDETIDKIYHWHILEGYDSYILKEFSKISWFLSGRQIKYISLRIYEFFWHFVDPKKVIMNGDGEQSLRLAIDLLGGFLTQLIYFNENRFEAIEAIAEAMDDLFNIVKIYKKTALKRLIITIMNQAVKEWRESDEKKRAKVIFMLEKKLKKFRL